MSHSSRKHSVAKFAAAGIALGLLTKGWRILKVRKPRVVSVPPRDVREHQLERSVPLNPEVKARLDMLFPEHGRPSPPSYSA